MGDVEKQLFQVDLRGVLDVFSNHLYSTSDVFLRELLQNGVDALRARRSLEPVFKGTVEFELDKKQAVLTVIDDGVGLTRDQVREVLSSVGSSSKRDVEERQRAGYIGQFGIGILSCFMVCDEIVILTQSIDDVEPSIEWVARVDGTFTVRELEKPLAIGTRVVLRLNEDGKRYAKKGVLGDVLTRYGSRIDEVVLVRGKQYNQRVSNGLQPWDYHLGDEEGLAIFRDESWKFDYDDEFLHAFSLNNTRIGIRGFAVLDGERVGMGEHRRHRVYSKGMFVTDQPGELIPRWAAFARIEIELNDVRLTASRESVYTDERYSKMKSAISRMLIKELHRLADSNPGLLRELVSQNDSAFREIAFTDDAFFDAIIGFLPFETNHGPMKLDDYLREHDVIRVTPVIEQFRMIGPIAGAVGQVVFNGGYTRHTELLERAGARIKSASCEIVDARTYVENLGAPDQDLLDDFSSLCALLDEHLEGVRCKSVLRDFAPGSMPAVYLEGRDETLARSLDSARTVTDTAWSEVVDALREQVGDGQTGRLLCLNARNPTITSLLHVDDPELVCAVWGTCYVRALLDAQQPLTEADSRLFAKSIDTLFRRSLSGGDAS